MYTDLAFNCNLFGEQVMISKPVCLYDTLNTDWTNLQNALFIADFYLGGVPQISIPTIFKVWILNWWKNVVFR
jgi:hypothetical protein